MSIKSLFAGWTRKICGRRRDANGGFCALGWIDEQANQGAFNDSETRDQFEHRIADYLRKHYEFQEDLYNYWNGRDRWNTNDSTVIANVNNMTDITPEEFARIDLVTRGLIPEEQPNELN